MLGWLKRTMVGSIPSKPHVWKFGILLPLRKGEYCWPALRLCPLLDILKSCAQIVPGGEPKLCLYSQRHPAVSFHLNSPSELGDN